MNPKGVIAESPGVKLDSKTVKSKVVYDSVAQYIELSNHQPILKKTEVQLTNALNSNFLTSNLSLKNTYLSSVEIHKLSQQNK